jgi:hypothetical protein
MRRAGAFGLLAALVVAVSLVAAVYERAADARQAPVSETGPDTRQPPVAPPPAAEAPPAAGVPECVPDQLLVKFRPGADPAAVAARYGATPTGSVVGLDVHVLLVPAGTVPQMVATFEADPDVEYAEPNGIARVPEAPPVSGQPCGPPPTAGVP